MGSAFIDWANIVKGIPQGSILDFSLFNIFVNDLLFFSDKFEFCYFADENRLYSCGINLDNIFTNLKQNAENVYEWVVYNVESLCGKLA